MIIVWDSINKATGWQAYDAVTAYLAFHAGEGGEAPPPVIVSRETPGGVRKARFLRRGYRLPWEQDDEPAPAEVTVTEKRRKRIRLPKEVIETVADAIPVAEPIALQFTVNVPDVPVKLPDDDDDDDTLLMML